MSSTARDLDTALRRMEAALDRIERAVPRPVPDAQHVDLALAARHERLKGTVAETLRDLDALIAGMDE